MAECEFVLANLNPLLSSSRNTSGAPPPSFLANGAVLVSISDSQKFNLRVTQQVFISYDNRRCLVSVWPYSRVQPGYIALDHFSLKLLSVPSNVPVARMPNSATVTPQKSKNSSSKNSSSKKSSSKKKRSSLRTDPIHSSSPSPRSTPRRNRFQNTPESKVASPTPIPLAKLSPVTASVPVANSIVLENVYDAMNSAECVAAVKRAFLGRVIFQDMSFPVMLLGREASVHVQSIHSIDGASVNFARITQNSFLSFRRPPADSQHLPLLQDLGGIDNAAAQLLAAARSFFDQSPVKNILPSHRGALLHGLSGTGKTMLTRAVARELNLHIEQVHGSAVFAETNNPDGSLTRSSGLEASFARAMALAPSFLVLNDIDSFAANRMHRKSSPVGASPNEENSDETRSLAHELVRLLDNVPQGVFVIGTTTCIDELDPALRRPGRLDKEIELQVPDASTRCAVLHAVSAKSRKNGLVGFTQAEGDVMVRKAHGCVHADIASAWNRAVSIASARNLASTIVNREDFQLALDQTVPSALRSISVEVPETGWTDIGGQNIAKTRLQEAVELPLSEEGQATLAELQLHPPRGILLYGPPGCSKTLLARAVATESQANFVSVRGPELLSKWVGASEKAVRSVFERARAAAPAVIFFDEIDALASTRDGHGGASAHSRVVAQLLTEMDGISENTGTHGERVVLIAATNRPDLLDPALLRPGRIDVQIYVGLPNKSERESILKVHTRKTPLAKDVQLEKLSENEFSGNMSGAELAALVREASLFAMENDPEGASEVALSHFESARIRVGRRTNEASVAFYEQYAGNTFNSKQ